MKQFRRCRKATRRLRSVPCYSVTRGEATKFNCPNCEAEYKLVRVEAPPTHDLQLVCLRCGGPLRNREGKFALKYFRTKGAKPRSLGKPKF